MQPIILLGLATAALAAPGMDLVTAGWEIACTKKNPNLAKAITQFCSKTDIVAPSAYAHNGVTVGDSTAWIWPLDGCPTSWVPQHWCYAQFFGMCVKGDKNGYNMNWHTGNGGGPCQVWHTDTKGRHQVVCKGKNGCN